MEYKELGKAIKQKTDLLDRVLSNTKETFRGRHSSFFNAHQRI